MMINFEEYKLTASHVEKLLDRRQSTTSFYLSVNTAIMAVVGLLLKDSQLTELLLTGAVLVLLIAGFLACGIWRSLLRQYEILIGWWYARLRELEVALPPDSAKLVTREYEELYRTAQPEEKIGLTQRELILNYIFSGLYIIFTIGIVAYFLL